MREALEDKRQFIRWFLDSQRVKEPKTVEILRLIMEEDYILENVVFVNSVRGLPTALLISADSAATVSYLCRIDGEYYEDIAEIIAILVNDPPPKLFLWLSYNGEYLIPYRSEGFSAEVQLDSEGIGNRGNKITELERELNRLVSKKNEKRARLLREIDQALDVGDKEKFFYLSSLYKKMQ